MIKEFRKRDGSTVQIRTRPHAGELEAPEPPDPSTRRPGLLAGAALLIAGIVLAIGLFLKLRKVSPS